VHSEFVSFLEDAEQKKAADEKRTPQDWARQVIKGRRAAAASTAHEALSAACGARPPAAAASLS